MAILKWILIVAVAGYLAVIALMYLRQRSIEYFPDTQRANAAATVPGAQEVVLDTADGEKVIVWHVPPRNGQPVLMYFHGNAGALATPGRAERFRRQVADGFGLVALSYRGYGGSSGSPTEAGFHADADAAYRFAMETYPQAKLVAFGESLGTGVAVALAARHPVERVILDAPFSSAVDVAAGFYWYLPVRLLMKDTFHSDLAISNVKAPLLIMHGERDPVVPIGFAERLYALANEPKTFVRFPQGGHVNLDGFGAHEVVKQFLATPAADLPRQIVRIQGR